VECVWCGGGGSGVGGGGGGGNRMIDSHNKALK